MSKPERKFQGIWIPAEVWLSKKLTMIEKIFLVEINSLDNEKGCYASNQYFAEFFGLSKGRCSQIIKSLSEKKLVKIKLIYEGKQVKERILTLVNKLNRGYLENAEGGGKYSKGGYLENDKDSNTKAIIQKDSNKEKGEKEINFPESLNREVWKTWKSYRFDLGKKYKTITGEQTAINQLSKLSHENQKLCIETSIANEYQGFFTDKFTGVQNATNNKSKLTNAEQHEYDIEQLLSAAKEGNELYMGGIDEQIPFNMET